jgi:hypothetical protein
MFNKKIIFFERFLQYDLILKGLKQNIVLYIGSGSMTLF